MTTYYVGVGGNDGDTGLSWDHRWLTIGMANATVAAGDTVYIGEGTYAECLSPGVPGALGNIITYQNYNGDTVIITGSNDGGGFWHCIRCISKDYIIIDGFILQVEGAGTYYWAKIQDSDHVTIKNCLCRMTVQKTVGGFGIQFDNAEYGTVEDCTFEAWGQWAGEAGDMIKLESDSPYGLIQGNSFWNCMSPHTCILTNSSYNVIRRNTFWNLNHRALAITGQGGSVGTEHNVFEENIVFGSHHSSVSGTGYHGFQHNSDACIIRRNMFIFNEGEGLSLQVYTGYVDCQYNRIYSNDIYGNGTLSTATYRYGVTVFQYVIAGNIHYNVFKNNVIAQNRATDNIQVFVDHQDGLLDDTEFWGNCIYDSDSATTVEVDGIGQATVAWWEANYPLNFGSNVVADPLFVDPEGFNFTYAGGSPCPGSGVALTTAVGAGVGSTSLTVADSLYFSYGFGIVDGDQIKIGTANPVTISNINYGTNVITLAEARSWGNGDAVNLYADSNGVPILADNTPDIGMEWVY